MFVIGKASKEEIKEMKEMGFEVERVDIVHFDLALDPTLDTNQSEEGKSRYEDNGDELVAIFLDCDIVQECRDIHSKEVAFSS